jgi:hypothetical protein
MDVDTLLKALDDDENSHLLELTNKKIRQMNLDILKQLHLSQEDTLQIIKKLKHYRYVDGMNELKYGSFIRWIPITDPNNIFLTTGAIFCEFKITNNGVSIVYKNFNNRLAQIKMDECLLFQKLTKQEMVLLSALDHLSK